MERVAFLVLNATHVCLGVGTSGLVGRYCGVGGESWGSFLLDTAMAVAIVSARNGRSVCDKRKDNFSPMTLHRVAAVGEREAI